MSRLVGRRARTLQLSSDSVDLFDEMAANVAATGHLVVGLVEDPPTDEADLARVRDREHRGDELLRQLTARLAVSYMGPFHREDLHALAERLEDVIDDLRHVAELLLVLRPPSIPDRFVAHARVLGEVVGQAASLIEHLPTKRADRPEFDAIGQLRARGDAIFRQALVSLFTGGHRELDVIRWKDILEALQQTLKSVEKLGKTVESAFIRQS